MGAAASTVSPEVFASLRDEYEKKKAEGLSDIELFDHLKNVFEKNSSVTVAVATVSAEASTGGSSDAANSDNINNTTVVVDSENNGEGVTVTTAVVAEN